MFPAHISGCLFCHIAAKKTPSEMLFEDDRIIAIKDIIPQAPVHLLIIPKKHFSTILEIQEEDHEMIGSIFSVANHLAIEMDIDKSGFRLVVNCGAGAGQSVFHIHYHLLGGRPMKWPPG